MSTATHKPTLHHLNKIGEHSTPQDYHNPYLQASINIGIIGHVSHGKTTLVHALTGVRTTKHKAEQSQNKTIKLGYANCVIYKCPHCPAPQCYSSTGTNQLGKPQTCKHCQTPCNFVRHVSFVDCPGHELLMATMLNGAAVMDAALLLVSAEKKQAFPAPQTVEHLVAAEFMGLRDVIVLQNKIDLCESRQEIEDHYQAICDLTDKYKCTRDSVVVPISAQLGYNIDAVLQMLAEVIPQPRPRHDDRLRMTVVRSFDVNKPGAAFNDLKGGVAGGTIHEGTLQVGDTIEIRPGLIVQQGGRKMYKPLQSTVTSLFSEQQSLEQAQAGGLIGVGTMLDPSLARADRLLGQVIGLADHMPPVVDALIINVTRIPMCDEQERIEFEKGQVVMLHIGASSIKAKIVEKKTKSKEKLTLELEMPVCVNLDEDRITVSVQVLKSWRLVGFASIVNGREVDRAQ